MSVLLDTSEPSERAPRLLNRPRGKLGYASSVAGCLQVVRRGRAGHLYFRKHSDRDLEHLSNNPK